MQVVKEICTGEAPKEKYQEEHPQGNFYGRLLEDKFLAARSDLFNVMNSQNIGATQALRDLGQ